MQPVLGSATEATNRMKLDTTSKKIVLLSAQQLAAPT